MAEYLIDYNRGSDAAAGSIAAPWQNLSKLVGLTLNSGDTVWLANDSTWSLSDRVLLGTIGGTVGSPVTIARRDTGGGVDAYPIITYQIPITAAQWTYDAPNNGWYRDVGFPPGVMSRVELGGTQYGMYQSAALPLTTLDRTFAISANRLYLYAPASQNPTDYYGSVIFSPSDRGAITASNDGGYLVLDGLKFLRQGTGIVAYGDTGSRELVVRNCRTYDTGPLLFINTNTAGEYRFTVEDCVGSKAMAAFVHANAVGGVGIGPYIIQRNRWKTSGLSFPQGAIYMQVRSAPGVIRYNNIGDAKYGTPLQPNDGCGIYAEIGASDLHVYGNYVYDSVCALQDNSGRRVRWTGNVINNCYMAMKVTDESNANATDHTFVNNTIIKGGSPEVVKQGPNYPSGQGWWAYETTAPAMTLNIQNNAFLAHPSAVSIGPAIETPASALGTINNNWYYGYSNGAESYTGGAASPTPTSTTLASLSSYLNNDGSLKIPYFSYGVATLNPIGRAGTYVHGVKLFNGRVIPGQVPIGAFAEGRY